MATKQNFLLMSLEDNKAKKIANILSNKSCSKILEFLTENEVSESEIAQKLNLPISTVHYNLKQLLEAKLIMWEKYHYSEKGKEVRHYTVANKFIIIAPKGDNSGFLDKLKTLIPTFIFLGIGASLINWYNNLSFSASQIAMDTEFAGAGVQNYVADEAPRMMIEETPALMAKAIPEAYNSMPKDMILEQTFETIPWYQDIIYQNWFWFLIGAVTGISIYLIVKWIRKKLN